MVYGIETIPPERFEWTKHVDSCIVGARQILRITIGERMEPQKWTIELQIAENGREVSCRAVVYSSNSPMNLFRLMALLQILALLQALA